MVCDFFKDLHPPQRRLARAIFYETLARLQGNPDWRYQPIETSEGQAAEPHVVPPRPKGQEHARSPRALGHHTYRRWTRETALEACMAFWRRYERFPLEHEWNQSWEHGLPSTWSLYRLLGGRNGCRAGVLARLAEEG